MKKIKKQIRLLYIKIPIFIKRFFFSWYYRYKTDRPFRQLRFTKKRKKYLEESGLIIPFQDATDMLCYILADLRVGIDNFTFKKGYEHFRSFYYKHKAHGGRLCKVHPAILTYWDKVLRELANNQEETNASLEYTLREKHLRYLYHISAEVYPWVSYK